MKPKAAAAGKETNVSVVYEYRVIGFLDVLGFSALVRSSAHSAAALQRVSRVVDLIRQVEKDHYEYLKLEEQDISFFSDTIIISTAQVTPDEAWIRCIRETGKLALEILGLGMPCRGAIVTGLCHHRRHEIVGPAIIEAYELERQAAIYPRIILDKSTRELWNEYVNTEDQLHKVHNWGTVVNEDADGLSYLNIFHENFAGNMPWSDYPAEREEFIRTVGRSIEVGLNSSAGDLKTHAKYLWLQKEFRRSLASA